MFPLCHFSSHVNTFLFLHQLKVTPCGTQQGLQQGLQQGELIIILKLLNNRLGSLPSDIQQQITNLSTSQLEKLSDQILHFTNQNELKQWLIHEN